MENIEHNKLVTVTDEQFRATRKEYNVTRESLNTDIDSLVSWYKQQPHLPQVELDRKWIERVLIFNKCSMERTKNKLDKIFSLKNLFPEFFQNRNPIKSFEIANDSMVIIMLPKLTADNKRVMICKSVTADSEKFSHLEFVILAMLIIEYRQRTDYSMGDHYIMDMKNQSFGHIIKYNPIIIKKAEYIIKEIFGHRISGVHILNAGSLLEKVILLFKSALSEKLSKRIQVYSDLESLQKVFPKEILPVEYGGVEKSDKEIFADWEKEICSEKYMLWMKEQEDIRSDESRRPAGTRNDDDLGIPGSFRKLTMD